MNVPRHGDDGEAHVVSMPLRNSPWLRSGLGGLLGRHFDNAMSSAAIQLAACGGYVSAGRVVYPMGLVLDRRLQEVRASEF